MTRAIALAHGPDDPDPAYANYVQQYYGRVNRMRFREIREELGLEIPEHLRVWLNDEDVTMQVHEVIDGPSGRVTMMEMRDGRMVEVCGHVRLRPLKAGPPR